MSTLDGLVVLDLSRYIAGPTASMMLADQGAEVIKVEPVPLGDPSRQSGPFDNGHSVYFMSANRNKRSLAVDLRSAAGIAAVKKIAATADVLIENFKPGTTEKMGIGAEQLLAINPGLVYCSISGFGDGPVGSTMAGFDQNAQGMSGLMSVTGTGETGPMRVGVPVADSTTGLIASFAILAKLHERHRTGAGGVVSTSLMQSTNFLLTYQA
ncbi:MAG: CoA transferase, partial [Ramlibacter sp.]|nr:CoA transferase [Cryobacterium sp.]